MTTFNANGVIDKIMQSAKEAAQKRVYELADSIQNGLLYEFQNDLMFAGHGKDRDVLQNIQVSVTQTQDNEYTLSMDMKGLTDNQRELFEFYFKNAKTKALQK